MDTKKWLMDRYNFFEEIFEHDGYYYLDFCLKEDACSFVDLCIFNDIRFTYSPPYSLIININLLKFLIKKIDVHERTINSESFENPLLSIFP
ncbi:MAG: hypothetical protein LBM96_08855 [Methanobrevibacter sp.]|jgi:hypothetical protein|nr:hypothetical protein [Candidatus Methanoflexus mossambicus]